MKTSVVLAPLMLVLFTGCRHAPSAASVDVDAWWARFDSRLYDDQTNSAHYLDDCGASREPLPTTILQALRSSDLDLAGEGWSRLLLADCRAAWGIVLKCGPDVAAEMLMSRFGQADALTDFRLLFCLADVTMPLGDREPCRLDAPATKPALGELRRLTRDAQLAFAETQTRLFQKDGRLRDRYYRALVWSGRVFADADGLSHDRFILRWDSLWSRFPQASEPEYWWWAREFVILTCAMSLDEFLTDVAPEDLRECWVARKDDILAHMGYVIPCDDAPKWRVSPREALAESWDSQTARRPDLPFDDWDATLAPPPERLDSYMEEQVHVEIGMIRELTGGTR